MRLLIIDDDIELVETLTHTLKKQYAVDVAYTASDGECSANTHDYDVLIIDFNLPDQSGVVLCKQLREGGCRIPILMLTGRNAMQDIVLALDHGADDYLTKPFSTPEFLARIRALFRRNALITPQTFLKHGDLLIDLSTGTVTRKNLRISLRRKEFQILEFLLRNRGQIIQRHTLLEHIWNEDREPTTNSIDVHIKQLRKKLFPDKPHTATFIKSIYGLGYQIT